MDWKAAFRVRNRELWNIAAQNLWLKGCRRSWTGLWLKPQCRVWWSLAKALWRFHVKKNNWVWACGSSFRGALESPVPWPNPTVGAAGIQPLCVGRACFHLKCRQLHLKCSLQSSQGWQLLLTEPRVRGPRIHGREFVVMEIQRSRWPTSHHHQPTTFQSAVSWSAPSLEHCLRSNGGFVGLTWEAENHNIGQSGNATYPWQATHGGNLQNWDCAGAQALYDFLMRWLVHSATHAASRTHLILWAFVSLSAAGESNQSDASI